MNLELENFLSSMEQSKDLNCVISKCVNGIHELQIIIDEKILDLCFYYDKVSNEALIIYAKMLAKILEDDYKVVTMSIQTYTKIMAMSDRLMEMGEKELAVLVLLALSRYTDGTEK